MPYFLLLFRGPLDILPFWHSPPLSDCTVLIFCPNLFATILSYNLNLSSTLSWCFMKYTGAPIVGIARWSVPRIGQGHLEVK